MGRWGIRSLETRVGRESSVSRGGARLPSGGTHVGGVRGGSHSDSAGGGGSSKSESCQELRIGIRKVVSTLDGPIWSKRSIALTCPARSHFQRTQSRERWGQGWDERYSSSREGGE